jgi:hypothetical protein
MRSATSQLMAALFSCGTLLAVAAVAATQQPQADTAKDPATKGADNPAATPAKLTPAEVPDRVDTADMVRLDPKASVWIDRKKHWVVVDAEVCLNRGTLEMFACPKGTKEHESILAVLGTAMQVHAGLLAVGAKPGQPATFVPSYRPASGTKIDIWLLWTDEEGKRHKDRAQDWVRNVKTRKAMEFPWVFAGSSYWTHPNTGERFYQGDGGDFICVSNFPTATLDIPVESSQSDQELLFEAFTERVPTVGTKVRLVLVPAADTKPAREKPAGENKSGDKSADPTAANDPA